MTPWTDQEKVALLLSLVKSFNQTPNWKNASLPVGRTASGAQQMYNAMIKSTAGVQMTAGGGSSSAATTTGNRKRAANGEGDGTVKKRGRAKQGVADGVGGNKRKGGVEDDDVDGEEGDDVDGLKGNKRVKVEEVVEQDKGVLFEDGI